MRKFLIFGVLAMAAPVSAAEFTFAIEDTRFVKSEKLQATLRSEGFTIGAVACSGRRCTLTASDAKMSNRSAAAGKFATVTTAAAAPYTTAKALVAKLTAGTANMAEKDQLLLLLAQLFLSGDS